jgi:uncharacterized membrane protein
MSVFVLGLIIFFAAHLFSALARGPRRALIGEIGELAYKGGYALVSAAGLALIVLGWDGADRTVLYAPPVALLQLTYVLTLIALILLAAAYGPKGRIGAAVKHPMLAGVKVWAFAHLLANGDVRSVMLFGSFLAFAVIDRVAVMRRKAPIPAAGPWRNDVMIVLAGAVIWAIIFIYAHPLVAGVPVPR